MATSGKKLPDHLIRRIHSMRQMEMTVNEIATEMQISSTTVKFYLRWEEPLDPLMIRRVKKLRSSGHSKDQIKAVMNFTWQQMFRYLQVVEADENRTLATQVRQDHKQLGLTRKELMERYGIGKVKVNNILNGNHPYDF